jgi:hypothetical protein
LRQDVDVDETRCGKARLQIGQAENTHLKNGRSAAMKTAVIKALA